MNDNDRNDRWDQLERHYSVGREEESRRFTHFLNEPASAAFILNVYGTGGIGKSYLLRQFRRIASGSGWLVCSLDPQILRQTPEQFLAALMAFAHQQLVPDTSAFMPEQRPVLQECFSMLNKLAAKRRVLLIVDEYESIRGLDSWLRDTLFRGLHPDIRIVIAGRSPLDGEWASSPAWRQFIARMPLEEFTRQEVSDYLGRHDLHDSSIADKAWTVSGGHPLYLSLAIPLLLKQGETWNLPLNDLVSELVEQWLKETTTEEIRSLIEYLSIPRSFNQELLSYMRGNPVTDEEFGVITGLSFVKGSARGWVMHDQMRETLHSFFRKKKPGEYHTVWVRCAQYTYDHLVKSSKNAPDPAGIGEYIGCVADSMVRAVLHSYTTARLGYRLETMDSGNFEEVRQYLIRRKQESKAKQAHYVDIQKDLTYSLHLPLEQDEIRAGLVTPEDWLALGLDSVKLLRDAAGSMLGLSVIIPINRQTLDYLSSQPVSSSYFQSLTVEEKAALSVSGHTQSGWYLRMLDVEDADNSAARSELMNHLLGYFQYGNLLITATSLPFYKKLLTSVGFREIEGCIHYDYGDDIPSQSYMLDLRKEHFHSYLQGMANMAGVPLSSGQHALTEREKEIGQYIVQGMTNNEIASILYLSEITVKKHVSSMLLKTGAKNRVQLTQLLAY